jgi:hypothetical protein
LVSANAAENPTVVMQAIVRTDRTNIAAPFWNQNAKCRRCNKVPLEGNKSEEANGSHEIATMRIRTVVGGGLPALILGGGAFSRDGARRKYRCYSRSRKRDLTKRPSRSWASFFSETHYLLYSKFGMAFS